MNLIFIMLISYQGECGPEKKLVGCVSAAYMMLLICNKYHVQLKDIQLKKVFNFIL